MRTPGTLGNCLGRRVFRGSANDREYGSHQQIVSDGGIDTPPPRALEQDPVDIGLGSSEEAIVQGFKVSSARRARSRSIAAS